MAVEGQSKARLDAPDIHMLLRYYVCGGNYLRMSVRIDAAVRYLPVEWMYLEIIRETLKDGTALFPTWAYNVMIVFKYERHFYLHAVLASGVWMRTATHLDAPMEWALRPCLRGSRPAHKRTLFDEALSSIYVWEART
jgi:hypothetical protein